MLMYMRFKGLADVIDVANRVLVKNVEDPKSSESGGTEVESRYVNELV